MEVPVSSEIWPPAKLPSPRSPSIPDADSDAGRISTQTLRHPSLYFEQGDIALSARDSDTLTYVFRVYRLFLTHHSSVFKTMIGAIESGPTGEEYDGVPLIALGEEDNAEDVASLLEVIYDKS